MKSYCLNNPKRKKQNLELDNLDDYLEELFL